MKNIILIGMPGAGKSTIGVLLAKSMLMDFCDTDLLIQKRFSCSLCELIARQGVDGFIKSEGEVLASTELENCVIATGGSAVYSTDAMKKLAFNAVTVYLKVSVPELERRIDNIHTRGIAMPSAMSIAELYEQRAPLYESLADITVACESLTAEQCVDLIAEKLKPC